ncbi:MAG: extensin family protein [Hyphomicrobium sp.]|jgi:hypothetical protein
MIRPRLACALICCGLLATGAPAAEQNASRAVIDAFKTVVVKPATSATKAAADAITTAAGNGKTQKVAGSKTPDGKAPAQPKQVPPAAKGPGATEQDTKRSEAATAAVPNDKDAKPADLKAAAAKSPPVAKEWPAVDIELAKARCTQLLKGLDAVTTPEPSFRDGDCGAPAPVRLLSIGKSPAVTFDPPALVTCDMVAALDKWISADVQPMARKHLGSPVTKVETLSDYSCRNAYGRTASKLSEHGRANALDIKGFVTSNGKTAYVLEGWGLTKRDIAKQIAAANAAAEKAEATKAEALRVDAAMKAAKASSGTNAPPPVSAIPRTTIVDDLPKVTIKVPGTESPGAKSSLSIAPAHLGGPKDKAAKGSPPAADKPSRPSINGTAALPPDSAAEPAPLTKTGLFLHTTHDAACQIFGTTLGPEANDAHRNHFHVDMAERKFKKICD